MVTHPSTHHVQCCWASELYKVRQWEQEERPAMCVLKRSPTSVLTCPALFNFVDETRKGDFNMIWLLTTWKVSGSWCSEAVTHQSADHAHLVDETRPGDFNIWLLTTWKSSSVWCSQAVTHQSANHVQCLILLTRQNSEISTWYGC